MRFKMPFISICKSIAGAILLLLMMCLPEQAQAQALRIDAFPKSKQLYPRDWSSNSAAVPVDATVFGASDWDTLRLRVEREGLLESELDFPLSFSGDSARIQTVLSIPAERANRSLSLYLIGGDSVPRQFRKADEVVAGDAYLVHGQSNAQAADYEDGADAYTDPFVRSFGRWGGVFNEEDSIWFEALGDANSFGKPDAVVGQWGMVMAKILTVRENVPLPL